MGFHREISKGAKCVPRAGEGGHSLAGPAQRPLDLDKAENAGLVAW